MVAVAAIAIALTAIVGDERFRALWNTAKSITDSMLVVMFCGALASGLRRICTVLVTLTLVG